MMKYVRSAVSLKTDRRGVTAVEYGIMAALIAVALTTAIGVFGSGLSNAFSSISSKMNPTAATK